MGNYDQSIIAARMIAINLLRSRIRIDGVFVRPPTPARARVMIPVTQFWKKIGPTWIRAPKLHRCGYRVTPDMAAPACRAHPGKYGDIVWIRIDRAPGLKMCDECFGPRGPIEAASLHE